MDDLNAAVATRYAALTEDDIKTLIVDDKWLSEVDTIVRAEMHSVSRALTGRVVELRTRYEASLPTLTTEAAELASRVARHLEAMGHSDAARG